MTFQATVTKSPISQSLTDSQRASLQEFLAKFWLDNISLRDLEQFFYEAQLEYLQLYSDEELIGEVEDVTSEEDFSLVISGDYDEA